LRFVTELLKQPQHCVFMPQIGSGHKLGFIVPDGQFDAWDNRLQPAVSIVALKEIARKHDVGLVPKEDHELALAEMEVLRNENADLKAQMTEYDKELDAITVLKARGYKPTQKPGRKPAATK
jgi:hypothetical protein